MNYDKDYNVEEKIGIVSCVNCGQRLDGEIECPFCSTFTDKTRKKELPKWIYITACFLTSPLSIYAIIKSKRLSFLEKLFTFSGCFLWAGIFII